MLPLYVCTTFCLFIHLSKDIDFASLSGLLRLMLLWTWVFKYLLFLPLIILEIYPEERLLDHIVVSFLILGGATILFSIAVASFYNWLKVWKIPISPHTFQHFLFSALLFHLFVHLPVCIDSNCYGQKCIPQNLYVEPLNPSTFRMWLYWDTRPLKRWWNQHEAVNVGRNSVWLVSLLDQKIWTQTERPGMCTYRDKNGKTRKADGHQGNMVWLCPYSKSHLKL